MQLEPSTLDYVCRIRLHNYLLDELHIQNTVIYGVRAGMNILPNWILLLEKFTLLLLIWQYIIGSYSCTLLFLNFRIVFLPLI